MNDVSSHFKIQEYHAELAQLSSQQAYLKVSCCELEKELNMASKSLAMGLCTQLIIESDAQTVAPLFNMHRVTNITVIREWVLTHLVGIGYPYQDTSLDKLSVLLQIELNKRVLDLH
jgi:hypothetical protein